jgi:hypothetical protein
VTPEGIAVGLFIAAVLMAVAVYYAGRQQATLEQLRFNTALAKDERRYLLKRSWRRLFGSLLLVVLALMLVGALFLNYDPPPNDADREAYKQSIRYVFAYVLTMLLVVMAILVVAIFDFWATARFGVEQRKQLVQEHQERLTAELAEYRQRHDFREGHPRADMN